MVPRLRPVCILASRQLLYHQHKCSSVASTSTDYDLVVIGGGSGGLACSKEAASLGKKVAVLDFVDPSPAGTKWGLGGTCVNVGCIPKKLMHQAALIGDSLRHAHKFGWDINMNQQTVKWEVLRDAVNGYIRSLNWGHLVQLKDKKVTYVNAMGTFLDPHTIKAVSARGEEIILKARQIVIATGGRPKYPEIEGAELGVTSDDIFTLKNVPGKTLVVGGSYVALECAGFLAGLGFPVSLMVRSIPLRGFDQEMASLVLKAVEAHGSAVIPTSVPKSVRKVSGGKLEVTWINTTSKCEQSDIFDTVLWCIGRKAFLKSMEIGNSGVSLSESGEVLVDEEERTNVPHIFAIGDVAHERPELTPVAIMAGKLLSRRLFTNSKDLMDYQNIATTVFTPVEYGCVGLAEEDANQKYGTDKLEVYHAFYKPLEFTLPEWRSSECYIKAIVVAETDAIVGLHFIGPNAGEVIQGFATAMQCGLTMSALHHTVGIHPTCAEEVVKVHITKRSGEDPMVTGC